MNRISSILILIMIWLACSSRTCTEDRNMNDKTDADALSASKDSIRKAFEVDRPGDDLIRAYEVAAKQKLSDFADYLKIVSDTSLNQKFREQAAEMVKRLFVNGDTDVRNWATVYSENNISTLNELLAKGLSKGFSLWIQPDMINLEAPLTARDDSTYTGRLSFYQRCLPFDIRKSASQLSKMASIEIYVIRKVKSFGNESLNVWEVYLGSMN
jgi:hypothetical protein